MDSDSTAPFSASFSITYLQAANVHHLELGLGEMFAGK
jgi:hypothetical protein